MNFDKDKPVETVTITRPLSGRLSDLYYFVKYLAERGKITHNLTDDQLVAHVRSYWDMAHGDDD